jgi:hypothetical protein
VALRRALAPDAHQPLHIGIHREVREHPLPAAHARVSLASPRMDQFTDAVKESSFASPKSSIASASSAAETTATSAMNRTSHTGCRAPLRSLGSGMSRMIRIRHNPVAQYGTHR